jgi:hypothetical protein
VILVKMYQDQGEIIIEQWQLGAAPSGATMTRHHRAEPESVQTVFITKPAGVSPLADDIFTIAGAPLVLDFELVFLRKPVEPQEPNTTVTENRPRKLATTTWQPA